MSVEEKFNAAVNVIRSLPKNGTYQPSHDLMLRFYAYFKQATEGPNTSPKPSFWEVVKKAKWDAWTKLGNMARNDAMIAYVDELNKIVETMAYTENVADFLSSIDSGVVAAQDLEVCAGPALDKMRNSPLASRETSPARTLSLTASVEDEVEVEDEDEEFFLDSEEHIDFEKIKPQEMVKKMGNGDITKLHNGHLPNGKLQDSGLVMEAIQKAVESLRRDLTQLQAKQQKFEDKQRRMRRSGLFGEMSRETVIFIVCWPFLVQLALEWFRNRRIKNI